MPLTRSLVKTFCSQILVKRGVSVVPSDGWLTKFMKRKDLSLRIASRLDGGRAKMGRESVVKSFFDLYENELLANNLSPEQIFNVDETGFGEGQYCSRVKSVCERGVKHPYIRFAQTREHISVVLCASASGRVIPPMIIFQKSFPHSSYASEGVPGSLYAVSESGHIDSSLYIDFITKLFIPNLPPVRPVLLLQDNHSSHLSFDLVKICRQNNIILLNLPPHTTHILQPLDHLFDTLKSRFTSTARTASLLRENLIITKNKFTAVFKQSLSTLTPEKIHTAFRKTGIHPFNPQAIDKTKLISDTHIPAPPSSTSTHLQPTLYMECTSEPNSPSLPFHSPANPQGTQTDICSGSATQQPRLTSSPNTTTQQQPSSSHTSSSSTSASYTASTQTSPIQGQCSACNTNITENPLVKSGIISPSLATILWVPPSTKKVNCKRKLNSKVLTSDESFNAYKQAIQEKENKEQLKKLKQEQRENLKIAKAIEKEEKQNKIKLKKAKKTKITDTTLYSIDCSVCQICFSIDPPCLHTDLVEWITCEFCDLWFHKSCTKQLDCENVYFCEMCLSK